MGAPRHLCGLHTEPQRGRGTLEERPPSLSLAFPSRPAGTYRVAWEIVPWGSGSRPWARAPKRSTETSRSCSLQNASCGPRYSDYQCILLTEKSTRQGGPEPCSEIPQSELCNGGMRLEECLEAPRWGEATAVSHSSNISVSALSQACAPEHVVRCRVGRDGGEIGPPAASRWREALARCWLLAGARLCPVRA